MILYSLFSTGRIMLYENVLGRVLLPRENRQNRHGSRGGRHHMAEAVPVVLFYIFSREGKELRGENWNHSADE